MSKRSRAETIELFRQYAYEYQQDARKFEKRGDDDGMIWSRAKAEAYETAAFELERNMK